MRGRIGPAVPDQSERRTRGQYFIEAFNGGPRDEWCSRGWMRGRSREFLAGKEAQALARDILAMTQEEFSAACKGSPLKRAKLRGLKRHAAVVLGNSSTAEDAEAVHGWAETERAR